MSGEKRFSQRVSRQSNTIHPGATELLSAPTDGGVVTVTVLGYRPELFDLLIDEMYSIIEGHWQDATRTAPPVMREAFRAYVYLAARTRIARVNNERRSEWPLRTNDEWVLPTQIVNVINSVGRVFLEETATLLVPVWPTLPVAEGLQTSQLRALTEDDFFMRTSISMGRIKRLFDRTSNVPVVFVEAIAGEREGDPDVMGLVPSYSAPLEDDAEASEPVRLHARAAGDRMVNGTVAFNYLAWALLPSVYRTVHVGLHPLEHPGGRYIESQAVYATWMKLIAKAVS